MVKIQKDLGIAIIWYNVLVVLIFEVKMAALVLNKVYFITLRGEKVK